MEAINHNSFPPFCASIILQLQSVVDVRSAPYPSGATNTMAYKQPEYNMGALRTRTSITEERYEPKHSAIVVNDVANSVIQDALALVTLEGDGYPPPSWEIRDERAKWEAEIQRETLWTILLGLETGITAVTKGTDGPLADIWNGEGLKSTPQPLPNGVSTAAHDTEKTIWCDEDILDTSTNAGDLDIVPTTTSSFPASESQASETVSWPPPSLSRSRSNTTTSSSSSWCSVHKRRLSVSDAEYATEVDFETTLNRTLTFSKIWSTLSQSRREKVPDFAEDFPDFLFEWAGTAQEWMH